MSVNKPFSFDAGFEFLLPHFIKFTKLRNYNNYPYLYSNKKWVYIKSFDDTFCHISSFYAHVFNEDAVITEQLTDNQKSSLRKLIGNISNIKKFINKMADYVIHNIPNTAINLDEIAIRLPKEITNLIFEFASGGREEEFIYKIVNKVLLSDTELIEKIALHIPEILTNTSMGSICVKYTKLYAFNHITHILRHNFCNEMCDKKSIPKNKKYIPIRKEDDMFFAKKIFFTPFLI